MTEQQLIQAKAVKTHPPYFHYQSYLASCGSPLFPIRINVVSTEKRMRIVDSFLWDLRTNLCGDQHDLDTSIALTAQQLACSILGDLDVQGMNRTVRHFSGRMDLWCSQAEKLIQRQIQEQLVEAHAIWKKALEQRKQQQLEEELYQSQLAEYHVQMKKFKVDEESAAKSDEPDKSAAKVRGSTKGESGKTKDKPGSSDKEQEGKDESKPDGSAANESSKSTKDLNEQKSKAEPAEGNGSEKSTEEKSEQDQSLVTEEKQKQKQNNHEITEKEQATDSEGKDTSGSDEKGEKPNEKKVVEDKDKTDDKSSLPSEAKRIDSNESKAEEGISKETASTEPMDIDTSPAKEKSSKESENQEPTASKLPVPPLKKRKRSSAHIVQIKLRMSVNGIRIHDDFQYDCSMAHIYSPMDMAKDLARDLNLNQEAMQAITLEILEQLAMFTGEPKPREKQVPFGWGEDAQILFRTVEERHKAWKDGQAPKSPAVALMLPSSGREISPLNTSAAWELDNKAHVTNIAYLVSQQKP